MSVREFMARVHPTILTLGAVFYFDPATLAVGKAHGLDGWRFYFLGRGGVLGDVEPEVVMSAFGYFEPGLITKMWNTAKERMDPREAGRLYLECGHEYARARFGAIEGLDEFCTAAEAVNDRIDPAGMALYAGVDAEPLPDDLPARALHLCVLLREARGSAHLVGVVASGLAPRLAHAVKRPTYGKLFGWSDEPEITDDMLSRWNIAEELTISQLEPAFGVLDDDGRHALLAGLDAMAAAATPTAAPVR